MTPWKEITSSQWHRILFSQHTVNGTISCSHSTLSMAPYLVLTAHWQWHHILFSQHTVNGTVSCSHSTLSDLLRGGMDCLNLKMKVRWSFESSGTRCPMTQFNSHTTSVLQTTPYFHINFVACICLLTLYSSTNHAQSHCDRQWTSTLLATN